MKTMTTRRKTAKMTTELVCGCGRKLEVSVNNNGWMLSLEAVALGNRWTIDHQFMDGSAWMKQTPAQCPECHPKHQCQCRDC